MKYYQEITLLPDAEINKNFLWQKIFEQIHLRLVQGKVGEGHSKIGVSFPDYDAVNFALGTRLRFFSLDENDLEKLCCSRTFECFSDYVCVSNIQPVPENITEYACFKRIRVGGNKEILARRRAKRKGEAFEHALAYYEKYEQQRSKLPFIVLDSLSTGQRFRLFVEKEIFLQEKNGLFNCYGLSDGGTVPLF